MKVLKLPLVFLITTILFCFTNCEKKEINNPFDKNCPKDIFTPSSFTAEQQGNAVHLEWEQENMNISGFIINRNENDGVMTELTKVDKSVTLLNDADLVGGNIKYGYELVAYAGENLSNPQLVYIVADFVFAVTTTSASNITHNSALIGGNVIDDGGSEVSERGVCFGISQNPTLANSKVIMGSGIGVFSDTLNGLSSSTTYYAKAYAFNTKDTVYGEQISFTTDQDLNLAAVSTSEASNITMNSAVLGGNVINEGGSAITERGICYSTAQNPTINDNRTPMGNGTGLFNDTITGLNENSTYYAKAYAINSHGISYGTEISFTTITALHATVTTANATNITLDGATLGGDVIDEGGSSVIQRGVCYSTSVNPTTASSNIPMGSGIGNFSNNISGLTLFTTYYARAYATNNQGTAYGNEVSFTTLSVNPPDVPLNITATPGDQEVTIKWYAVTDAISYNIYWSTNPDVSKTNYEGKIADIAETTYLHTGLTSGTTYYYVATAQNDDGESGESSVARATPPLLLQTNTMSLEGEKHFYQVSVSSGQNLFITNNIKDAIQNYYIYIKYDTLPTTSNYDFRSITGQDEAISIINTLSGTYYIMVYSANHHPYYTGSYTITGSTSVVSLTLESFYNANMTHEQEKDYYEVIVSEGQNLFINTHIFNSIQRYYLYLKYESLPTLSDYDAISATGDDEIINIQNTQSGVYYLMVYSSNYHPSYNGSYTIKPYLW